MFRVRGGNENVEGGQMRGTADWGHINLVSHSKPTKLSRIIRGFGLTPA